MSGHHIVLFVVIVVSSDEEDEFEDAVEDHSDHADQFTVVMPAHAGQGHRKGHM